MAVVADAGTVAHGLADNRPPDGKTTARHDRLQERRVFEKFSFFPESSGGRVCRL
jgi:hypothetical protein